MDLKHQCILFKTEYFINQSHPPSATKQINPDVARLLRLWDVHIINIIEGSKKCFGLLANPAGFAGSCAYPGSTRRLKPGLRKLGGGLPGAMAKENFSWRAGGKTGCCQMTDGTAGRSVVYWSLAPIGNFDPGMD
jgi:hypothetical protein